MGYNLCVISLLQKTAQCLRSYTDKKLAIGVSGGRDSMCLLRAVIDCGVIDKTNILAVHVNHNLRDNAKRDEQFVRSFCIENEVPFRAFSVDVKNECEKSGYTVEQAARNLRYGVFYDLIKHGDADVILTAHHALDNAETVLMHLFRGAGLDGLRGMSNGGAGYILRPFLDVYPRELDEYCELAGIDFVTDETNLIDDADRNFIRLNVIPMIERRYAGAVRAINRLAGECSAACDVLDGALDMSNITFDNGAAVIAQSALCTPLADRYVRRALSNFTTVDITREQTERVVSLAHMRTGATVELTGGMEAAREYNGVSIYIPRLRCDAELPVSLGANVIDGLAVDIDKCGDVSPRSVKGGVVDFDKLRGATLRFRRDGDMFTPFGGKTKKLKQYFIDSKIPKRIRDRAPLICKGSEVLVIVGVQISDGVKITDQTSQKAIVKRRW